MLRTKYQGFSPGGFRQEDFSCFPYISPCKTCDPYGHNLNKLGRGPLGDAIYQCQGSRPCGFRLEDF